jgi:hypothetical protein
MNGLTVIDAEQIGLGKEYLLVSPAERAYVLVNNLLATTRIREVTAAAVAAVLGECNAPAEELRPRFRTLYAHVLQQFALDQRLTDLEEADLLHLKGVLGLTAGDVEQVFRSVVHGNYEQLVLRSAAGQVSGGGAEKLRELAESLKIPESVTDALLKRAGGNGG